MESAEQVLENEENLEDQDIEDEQTDIEAPLELLSSVSARLLRGEIPTNPRRLQSLFEHIQSVVGDVVDASFAKITAAFDQIDEGNQSLREDGDDSPDAQAYFEAFETGREHVEEGLAIMHETFFSAQNFEDLEEFEEEFREAEVQLAEGLGRIETALMQLETPELFDVSPLASSQHIEDASESFAVCLEAISAHLEDGDPEHLEFVLTEIDKVRAIVETALEEFDEDADEETSEPVEEETGEAQES